MFCIDPFTNNTSNIFDMNLSKKELQLAEQKCSKAISIFCGVCSFDVNSFEMISEGHHERFSPWKFHVNPRNEDEVSTIKVLYEMYYSSFISSIFPG